MNLFVLLKSTYDSEEKIMIEDNKVLDDGVEFIINPYDEYAVEEAIRQRDIHGGNVTVITVGTDRSEKQLRTALAMGADKAVLINIEDDFEETDQSTTAKLLAAYLGEENIDMIFAGNVAIDKASGQVGPRVADQLDLPCVTTITDISIDENIVKIERDVEGDIEYLESPLPLLVTCQQGLNEPRYPSLPGIMKAKKKPLEELDVDDLELEAETIEPKTKTVEVFLSPEKQAGKVLEGDLETQVKELVSLLRNDAKVI